MHQDLDQNPAVARGLLKESIASVCGKRFSPQDFLLEKKSSKENGHGIRSRTDLYPGSLEYSCGPGIGTKGHGRSARVLKLEKDDIIHIYQVRGVLEGLAQD